MEGWLSREQEAAKAVMAERNALSQAATEAKAALADLKKKHALLVGGKRGERGEKKGGKGGIGHG